MPEKQGWPFPLNYSTAEQFCLAAGLGLNLKNTELSLEMSFADCFDTLTGREKYRSQEIIRSNGNDKRVNTVFAINPGIFLYGKNYFIGYSTINLFRIADNASLPGEINKRIDNLLTGGYMYNINKNYLLEPSVILKIEGNYTVKIDVNLNSVYKDMLFAGLGSSLDPAGLETLNINLGFCYSHSYLIFIRTGTFVNGYDPSHVHLSSFEIGVRYMSKL